MELCAIEDYRAVLAAEEDIAVSGGGLAVHAWALGGFSKDLALLIQMLDSVAFVLGSLGDNYRAILQRYSHAVVCGAGVYGIDRLGIVFANVFGLVNFRYSIAV